MNCIGRGCVGKERIIAINSMHPVRNDAGLPIITMYDIRSPVKCAHRFKCSAAEQDETLTIISVAVDILTIKIARGIDHIDRYPLTNCALANAYLLLKLAISTFTEFNMVVNSNRSGLICP